MKPAKITLSVILFVFAIPISTFQILNMGATIEYTQILEALEKTTLTYTAMETMTMSASLLMLAEFFTWLISFPLCITAGVMVLVGIKKRKHSLLWGILLAGLFVMNCITGGIHHWVVYIESDVAQYLSFYNIIYDNILISTSWSFISNSLLFAPTVGFIICGILDKKANKTKSNAFSQSIAETITIDPPTLDTFPFIDTPTVPKTAPVTPAPTSITPENDSENIKKLKIFKELLDQGIITQEEFDAKKKQLLNF